jgi:hypothetical protein
MAVGGLVRAPRLDVRGRWLDVRGPRLDVRGGRLADRLTELADPVAKRPGDLREAFGTQHDQRNGSDEDQVNWILKPHHQPA